MSSVVISGDTSGSVTLQAPAVAGTTVLTLPATSGTVVVTATGQAGFPSGTKMSFYQTAAPTGWTKDTTAALNDAILRIVTGSAGVTGGSVAFSTWAAVSATSAYTLTTSDIPSHTHTFTGGLAPYNPAGTPGTTIGGTGSSSTNPSITFTVSSTGGGGGHSHGVSSQNLKYADFIVATAN
jgi:hypothetical protein